MATIDGRPLPAFTVVLPAGDSVWMVFNAKLFGNRTVVETGTFGIGSRNALRDVRTLMDTTAYRREVARYLIGGPPPDVWIVRGDTLRREDGQLGWIFLRAK